jgi:MurE/MurF fusion protein
VKLSRLLRGIALAPVPPQMDVKISGIQTRAQDIMPGQVFLAIQGYAADGHDYMDDAFARGAAAVIAQKNPKQRDRVFLVDNSRKAAGAIAARFYKDPSRDMTLVGVTGTNGKTTITYLLEHIFRAAGFRCGVMGTINIRYDGATHDTSTTTPDACMIQHTLAQMKAAGITHVIMEVSSHGLDQFRVDGCRFDLGIFTNLTQDHLDYHPDMTAYFLCKKRFFTDLLFCQNPTHFPAAVINVDDPWGARLANELEFPAISTSCKKPADATASDIMDTIQGINGRLNLGKEQISFTCALTGGFNLENILSAAAAAYGLGVCSTHIQQGLKACTGVPGRLEKVAASLNRYLFVDYAHTPDALESVLKTLKKRASRRLITVFGCGGDRDRTKRPLMGKIACKYSDVAIVTSDNPRTEDPEHIITDIMAGIEDTGTPQVAWSRISEHAAAGTGADIHGVTCQADRKKALFAAVRISRPGDIVLAAGKGHETYQITRNGTIHFDDRKQLAAACDEMAAQFVPIAWNRTDLASALGSPPVLDTLDPDTCFAGISTDSRTIQADEVFVALTGDTFDAHVFIADLVNQGIQAFVTESGKGAARVEKQIDFDRQPGRLVFEIPDTLAGLGKLGRHQRLRSGAKVLAITGSNGKTTTRKMAQKIFETTFDTLATQKNYNNEIGVPKTLLALSLAHQWAVVEMGMNQPGEMKRLSAIACPDIALVTNTSGAHLAGLKTADNVARQKAQIFDHAAKNSVAVIFKDDPRAHILETHAGNNPDIGQVLTFGLNDAADVFATDIRISDNMTRFLAHIQGETAWFHLHSPARFMVYNALAALAAASAAGIRVPDMQAGLAAFTPVSGRMNIRTLDSGIFLIDDTYNANPASMAQALKTLAEQAGSSEKDTPCQTVAILGDMLELGEDQELFHKEAGKTAAELGIRRLYLLGPLSRHTCRGALEAGMPKDRVIHGTKQQILDHVLAHTNPGDWALVKGSRGMAMETLIHQWEKQITHIPGKGTKD